MRKIKVTRKHFANALSWAFDGNEQTRKSQGSQPQQAEAALFKLCLEGRCHMWGATIIRNYLHDLDASGYVEFTDDELADWDSEKKTARCDPELLSEGTHICTTDLPSKEAENWVREIRRYSGQKVDWGYCGGRVVVKALGDLDRVAVAMRNRAFIHDPWENGVVYIEEPESLQAKPKSESGAAAREAVANPSNPLSAEEFQKRVEYANRRKVRVPPTPGEILEEEFLKPAGVSREAFIEHIGYHPPDIHGVIDEGDRIDGRLARTIGEATNTTSRFWLNLQHAVDEYQAIREDLTYPECLDAFSTETERE